MRKITLLLSTLTLISMLLVACGGQGTETAAPATDLPTLEEPTVELTEELPDGTETGVPTGEETGTPDGGIPVTGEEDPSRFSNLLDYTVWNQNGEQIGEVTDMVVDLGNTMVSYVIVGTGGFLETGDRDILVPWDQLMLQTEGGDMTGGEQFAFILQADQQLYENAPDFDLNTALPQMGQPAGDWDADLRNYWEGGIVPAGTGTPAAGGTADTGTGQTGTGTPDAGTGGTADATAQPGIGGTQTGALQGVMLASDLLGMNVNIGAGGEIMPGTDLNTATPDAANDNSNANGNTNDALGTGTPDATNNNGNTNGNTNDAQGTPGTGVQDVATTATIDDVLVDIDTGDILYVVLSGAFPEGERLVPVPLSQFNWDATNDGTFMLNVDQTMFMNAPFFEGGQYPSTLEGGWDTNYSGYWQTTGTGGAGGADATATP